MATFGNNVLFSLNPFNKNTDKSSNRRFANSSLKGWCLLFASLFENLLSTFLFEMDLFESINVADSITKIGDGCGAAGQSGADYLAVTKIHFRR